MPRTPIKTIIMKIKFKKLQNFDTVSKKTYDNDTEDKNHHHIHEKFDARQYFKWR